MEAMYNPCIKQRLHEVVGESTNIALGLDVGFKEMAGSKLQPHVYLNSWWRNETSASRQGENVEAWAVVSNHNRFLKLLR